MHLSHCTQSFGQLRLCQIHQTTERWQIWQSYSWTSNSGAESFSPHVLFMHANLSSDQFFHHAFKCMPYLYCYMLQSVWQFQADLSSDQNVHYAVKNMSLLCIAGTEPCSPHGHVMQACQVRSCPLRSQDHSLPMLLHLSIHMAIPHRFVK